jgi:hypoxanthine phosphoribosyltransferase
VESLVENLRSSAFDAIVGISRSGLIPAVMLSHALGIRDFAVLDITRTLSDDYHSRKHAPVLRDFMNIGLVSGKRILLVDDIVGACETLRAARSLLENVGADVTAVTLVFNAANSRDEDCGALDLMACRVETWVEFPWECKNYSSGDFNA